MAANCRRALLTALCVVLSACDVDPFNAGCRHVADSGYDLCQFEGGESYYLEVTGRPDSGLGVVGGNVLSVGWNNDVIIAARNPQTADDPGFMVVTIRTKAVSGPFDRASILRSYPGVRLQEAHRAWVGLHWGFSSL
jgi:hypothetical protein